MSSLFLTLTSPKLAPDLTVIGQIQATALGLKKVCWYVDYQIDNLLKKNIVLISNFLRQSAIIRSLRWEAWTLWLWVNCWRHFQTGNWERSKILNFPWSGEIGIRYLFSTFFKFFKTLYFVARVKSLQNFPFMLWVVGVKVTRNLWTLLRGNMGGYYFIPL